MVHTEYIRELRCHQCSLMFISNRTYDFLYELTEAKRLNVGNFRVGLEHKLWRGTRLKRSLFAVHTKYIDLGAKKSTTNTPANIGLRHTFWMETMTMANGGSGLLGESRKVSGLTRSP